MTTDITIGKLKFKTFDEILKEKLKKEDSFNYTDQVLLIDFIDIEQCPDEKDGCTKEDTIFPNSAYRSGSSIGIRDFYDKVEGMSDLIEEMAPLKSNDTQYCKIKPFLKQIKKLKYSGESKQHQKRLHWFKFWCNRAVELYNENAGIMWS